MKSTTTLFLALALTATTIAQAGLIRAKAIEPTRSIYQTKTITPTLIYAQPSVNPVPPVVTAPVPYVQPLHLELGLQLVDEINATHSLGIFEDEDGVAVNRYGGSWEDDVDPSFIRFFDENNNILPANNTECAPLVTHLMLHAYGWDWGDHEFDDPKEGIDDNTTESPNPWQYLALIQQREGFATHVTNIRHAKPGDIISIHYLDGDSGHTAILVDLHLDDPIPYPEQGNNLNPDLADTVFYRMTIMDSTASPHTNDTREFSVFDEDDEEETQHEIHGAGIGDMGIFLNEAGQIVGHTWSLSPSNPGSQGWINGMNSRLKLQTERKMVFGRLPQNP
ncbi:MAG: hypothetical protein SynsKO_41270 [Synoicihabitans sp.]